ncbi:MAG: hypothetical protein ABSF08_14930 [Candidatus Cybelea sp.]|jgi:hypothetical protein
MTSDPDLTRMTDPEFLAERARVRTQLEYTPSAELTDCYQRLTEEFIRRARIAWTGGGE